MKKSRKKILLSSIAMLLVALVALGSATYAWFTINKTVEANTIDVKAAVAAGLQITNNNGGDWDRTVSYTGEYELKPVSVPGVAADTTLATSAFMPNDVQAGGVAVATTKAWSTLTIASERPSLSETAGTTGDDAVQGRGTNGYFAAYRMGIRSSDGTTDLGAVKATISCTTTSKNAANFAKAVLLDSSNKIVAYYNDAAYNPIATVNGDSFTAQATAVAASAQTTVQSSITTATYYTLLVWYEGNDAQCIDDNQGAQADFTVSFTL